MKYLDFGQTVTFLQIGKSVEIFLETSELNGHTIFKWVSIERHKDDIRVYQHEVFDDRDEGIETIYDFSYVEPDDLYGRNIKSFLSVNEALEFVLSEFKVGRNNFLPEGNLDQEIEKL